MNSLTTSNINFPGQKSVYHGKVRDVHHLDNNLLIMVASDRISAFDHILPKGIPFKGQVLNQVATMFLDATRDSILDDVIYIDGEKDGVPVEVAMVYNTSYTENVFSYVNNINTHVNPNSVNLNYITMYI